MGHGWKNKTNGVCVAGVGGGVSKGVDFWAEVFWPLGTFKRKCCGSLEEAADLGAGWSSGAIN